MLETFPADSTRNVANIKMMQGNFIGDTRSL